MNLLEKHQKVLEIIKSGSSLKDDTYLSQFLETTGSILHSIEDVDKFGLLDLIYKELADSSSGCCVGGVMALKDPEEQNILWNFIIDLSTTVIKSVPELTFKLLGVVGICDVTNHVNSNYIPILQFYSQVFKSKYNILEIASFLCKENHFWNKFLNNVNLVEANNYVTKSTIECFADYVKFFLNASQLNQRPKGCEIKVQLESNLNILVSEGIKADTSIDIFGVLNKIVESLDQEKLERFLFPLIKDNIDFDKLLLSEKYAGSSTILNCYIKTYLKGPSFQNIISYLKSIFTNPKHSIDTKKKVIVIVSKFPELSQVLKLILDQFIENNTEAELCQYFFNFHTVKSMMDRCKEAEIAQKVFSLIVKHLDQYSKDIYDEHYSDNFIKNVCLFGSSFFKVKDVNLFDVVSVINPILNISKQKLGVDDFVRSEALGLLNVIIRKIGDLESFDNLVRTLGVFACDTGSLYVVRDSALICISSLLLNRNLALRLSDTEIELISCVILKASSGKDQLVKGSAVKAQTSMLEHLADKVSLNQLRKFFPSEDVNPLDICDIYSDEERIEMMNLASKVHEKLEDPDILKLVKYFVLTSLEVDTNWDVKVHSVQFWKSVYRKASVTSNCKPFQILKHLEEHSFFTGLVLGCQDYEDSVVSSYFKFTNDVNLLPLKEAIGEGNHSLKRKVEEVSNVEPRVKKKVIDNNCDDEDAERAEEIEDLLDETDTSLVNMLTERVKFQEKFALKERKLFPSISISEFLDFHSELLNPEIVISQETKLESVLDDIIQSSSDESQIDLVDCY